MLLTMLLITFPLTDTTKVLYSVFPIIFCCISEFENRFEINKLVFDLT